ncbi:hypothetical protein BGZ81_005020 [Podila clonocystis]|nr:hypothetical protein BGZ81_005020 [Podila clonocystis]
MKFSFLPSLGALAGWSLSRHGQTSFQAPHHATSLGPGHIRYPAYVFNNQALFIGNSDPADFAYSETPDAPEAPFQTAIFSLDLTVPWSTSAPAWRKIDRPVDFAPDNYSNPSGQMVMNKDGSIIYFFQDMGVRPYYVHKGAWGPVANLTSELMIKKSLMVDSDLGHIYGIGKGDSMFDCGMSDCGMSDYDFEWTLRMYDPVANVISVVSEIPPQANPKGGRGVYSSARKSFFFMSSKGATTFHEYNIADKTWAFVRATGDVPSPRMGVACYAPVNNGKQILLVGGARSPNLEVSTNDEYEVKPTPSEAWAYPRSTWPPQHNFPTAGWQTYSSRSAPRFILPGGNFPTGQPRLPRPAPNYPGYPGYGKYRDGYDAPRPPRQSTTYYANRPPPAATTYPRYGYYRDGYDTPQPPRSATTYDAPRPPPAATTYPGYDYYRDGYDASDPPRAPPTTTTYPGYDYYQDGYPPTQPSSSPPTTTSGSMEDFNKVLNDVFMFDVETSVWTKVTTTPVRYHGSACAVSGDSLILYGGYNGYYLDGLVRHSENDNVPSIYDMKKNIWVSTYIPH